MAKVMKQGGSSVDFKLEDLSWVEITGDQSTIDLGGFNVDAAFLGITPTWTDVHKFAGSSAITRLVVERTGAGIADDNHAVELKNANGGCRLLFTDATSGITWRVATEAGSDDFGITKVGSGAFEFRIKANGAIKLGRSGAGTELTSADGLKTEVCALDNEGHLTLPGSPSGTPYTPHALTDVTTTGQTRILDVANGPIQTIEATEDFTLNATGPSGKMVQCWVYIYNSSAFNRFVTSGSNLYGQASAPNTSTLVHRLFWDGTNGYIDGIENPPGDLRPT